MKQPLLDVIELKKYYPITRGVIRQREIATIRAVDGVTFQIGDGETVGLVGESGCGKTTTGQLVLGLERPTAGQVSFKGVVLSSLTPPQLRKMRSHFQMVFQDPFSSLSPRMRVGDLIGEPLHVHDLAHGWERRRQVLEVMDAVGLVKEHYDRYPHEFSGGQRQRVAIARALVLKPRLIVADEPVSALDASIQSQILNLLMDLQQEFQLTYLFIAHNLNVIYHVCDRVLVMYLGKIVESAEVTTLFEKPRHPYTQALIAAKPELDATRRKKKLLLKGAVPSASAVPSGCAFHPRCFYHLRQECREVGPRLVDIGDGHFVRCYYAQSGGTTLTPTNIELKKG